MGRRNRSGGAFFGAILILIGATMLLERLDVIEPRLVYAFWEYWPLLFMGWGLFRILQAESPRRVGGGVTTLLFGVWFLICETRWQGLTWGTSWPMVLVAIGSGMIVRALLERTWRPSSGAEEVHDERC